MDSTEDQEVSVQVNELNQYMKYIASVKFSVCLCISLKA